MYVTPISPAACEGTVTAGLIDAIGELDFERRALQQVARVVRVESWSVYGVSRETPPAMLLAATTGRADVTADCWRMYRDGLYRQDRSFDTARDLLRGCDLILSHVQATELPAAHREAIYERHRLQERVSILAGDRLHGLVAMNFYRFADEPGFSTGETTAIARLAPALMAAVRRHQALASTLALPDAPAATPDVAARLRALCPSLTAREVEVCRALLRGLTFDGVAAHLGISPATVKTYRDRAFRSLGIHHRNQLYSLCMDAAAAAPRVSP